MKRQKVVSRIFILLFFLLIASVLFPTCRKDPVGPHPPQQPDTSSHNFAWRFDTLGTYPAYFNDVWGSSPTDVYAVGFLNAPTGQIGSYMEHYDGIAWQQINSTPLLRGLGSGGLSGIHGMSDHEIVVVGTTGSSIAPPMGFIGYWDGTQWTNITPPGIQPLHTVWMRKSDDIFAGGGNGYVIHYNGVHWDSIPSGTTLDVWRIFGLPTGEVYGVASDYWNSPRGSVILRIDSSEIATVQVISGRSLFALWGDSRANLYAVGEGVFHQGSQSIWQDLGVQRPATTLFGIGAIKGSDVLAGGYLQTLIHWNGVSWKFYDSLYVPTGTTTIWQIRAIGDTYFCVGTSGSLAFAMIGKHN